MVVYIKHEGKLYTYQDLAAKYNVPTNLIASRWRQGVRDIDKLVKPKRKEDN